MEIVISNKGATLEGTASDARQKPFSNAEVIAIPSDLKLRKRFDLLTPPQPTHRGISNFAVSVRVNTLCLPWRIPSLDPFMTDLFLKQNSSQIQTVKLEPGTKQLQLQVISAQAQ